MSATGAASISPGAGNLGRGRALLGNVRLWVLICGAAVLLGYTQTAQFGHRIGPYWSGLVTLLLFIGIAWYSVRKRNVWVSVRVLRLSGRLLPTRIQRMLIALDRLETWRAFHVTVGMLTLLPFWWHIRTGLMSPLEAVLAIAVGLLFVSGLFGLLLQDYLPGAMGRRAEREVRLQDVAARIGEVYLEAKEKRPGHSEALEKAFAQWIDPIFVYDRPALVLLGATLSGSDPGARACADAAGQAAELGDEAGIYREMVALAVRKVNLEHNAFQLRLSTGWLQFHIALAIATFVLVAFHVAGAIYFGGI